jgi:broad specificity phosphatase PhoE
VGGRRLVVEADGGSRGNPGNAGYGALVRDALSGEVVADLSAAGGSVTYTWVRRIENSAGDALANSAMDGTPVNWTRTPGAVRPAPSADATAPLADMGEPARIILVRHGVTDFTAAGRLDGRGGPDPSLNFEGRRQARALAAEVRALIGDNPARVISSSLKRAVETGAAIADELGVQPQIDADWDEQGFGDWDEQRVADLAARYPEELLRLRQDRHYARPGGEAQDDLEARVLAAFGRVKAAGGTVVVASHRKPIITLLAHVLGIPYERIWRLATAPASLTSVEVWADGGLSVAYVNDTSHLR